MRVQPGKSVAALVAATLIFVSLALLNRGSVQTGGARQVTVTMDASDGTAVFEATARALFDTEESRLLTATPEPLSFSGWDMVTATEIAGALLGSMHNSPFSSGDEGEYVLSYVTEISTTETAVLHGFGIPDSRIESSPGTLVGVIIEGSYYEVVTDTYKVLVFHRRDGVLASRVFRTFAEARAFFP